MLFIVSVGSWRDLCDMRCFCMGSHESFPRLYNVEQIILCHHFALDNRLCASLNSDTFSFYAIMPYLMMLPCLLCASVGPTCTLAFLC